MLAEEHQIGHCSSCLNGRKFCAKEIDAAPARLRPWVHRLPRRPPPGQGAQSSERALAPTASDGGRAELLPARPVAPDADPITRLVADALVDGLLNASEGGGLVRTDKRQISLALAADRPVDSVTIEALATNARATLDVRQAYSRACEADRNSKWCRR